ncbi:Uncharacterised protein [Bordetella pertussis]|nr:Uncharacterised protein [Bordetella pertussis]
MSSTNKWTQVRPSFVARLATCSSRRQAPVAMYINIL